MTTLKKFTSMQNWGDQQPRDIEITRKHEFSKALVINIVLNWKYGKPNLQPFIVSHGIATLTCINAKGLSELMTQTNPKPSFIFPKMSLIHLWSNHISLSLQWPQNSLFYILYSIFAHQVYRPRVVVCS